MSEIAFCKTIPTFPQTQHFFLPLWLTSQIPVETTFPVHFLDDELELLPSVNIPWDCQYDWCRSIAHLTLLASNKCPEICADFPWQLNLVPTTQLLSRKLSLLPSVPYKVLQWGYLWLKTLLQTQKITQLSAFAFTTPSLCQSQHYKKIVYKWDQQTNAKENSVIRNGIVSATAINLSWETSIVIIPHICLFFLLGQNFWIIKFTPKNATFLR